VRRRHRRQQGVTLIELLATIALMATAVVGLLGLFSSIQLAVSAGGDDARLAVVARQVGGVLQSESFAYVACSGRQGQAPAGLTPYQTTIRSAVSTSYTISIVAVQQAQSSASFHTVAGVPSLPLQPVNGCTGSNGSATTPDFGVQQITFKVASARNSLVRVVYKRWN